MKIQIICQGSVNSGLGHLFRANTFAKEASKRHRIELIAMIDKGLENVFSYAEYPVFFVGSEQEIVQRVSIFKPDILCFDLLRLQDTTLKAIFNIPQIKVSLSPVFNQMESMDLMYTRSLKKADYDEVVVRNGLQYAIFSEHCRKIPDEIYESNLKLDELPVSISMGGTDASNKTLKVLKELSKLNIKMTVWAILGEGYHHSYNQLISVIKNKYHHEVILAKTNRSMWNIIGNTVLGIFAGGLTTVEALYAGLPSINLIEKNMQEDIIDGFVKEGYCFKGGYFDQDVLKEMTGKVLEVYEDRSQLVDIRKNLRDLISLNGSKVILDEIEEFCLHKSFREPIQLRGCV
ncbi:MAG: hypothetical protein RO469_06705 [Thermincola sp.]|jgi:spore coat polysaccharide biosynthesis predicted glycosyltransferase SpsG|nr:hypothetical protein [Thermincola sp.]MDT3703377.1 hypothetical protein [Thermincola sp.]